MSQARDLNPLWQAVLCVLLAFLVMRCWSEEGESQPLDLFVVKRTATDRSTTSKPGPMRWEMYARPARVAELAKIWQDMYAKYRIGERLRPCPGCIRCNCSTGFAAWPELGKALIIGTECDGSGVLPARRSK